VDFIDRLFQHSPKATRVAAMRPLTCSVSYVDGNETSLQTCQVDLDALCHDGTVTVADLKLHFDGSSRESAVHHHPARHSKCPADCHGSCTTLQLPGRTASDSPTELKSAVFLSHNTSVFLHIVPLELLM